MYPEFRKLGSIPFASNAYGAPDLFAPNGGLPIDVYKEFILDVQGTLTLASTVNPVAVSENPRTLIKEVAVLVSGSPLSDSFLSLPLSDLEVLNESLQRSALSDPAEDKITSGADGAYAFRGRYRLPFAMLDMKNPYKGFLPVTRLTAIRPGAGQGQVTLRIKWGTAEDLAAGGTFTTKAISNCTCTVYGVMHTSNPLFAGAPDLFFHQRVAALQVAVNATANVDRDLILPRTNAFLRQIMLTQFTMDANGVETPVATLIRGTDPVVLMLNNVRQIDSTWEQLVAENRRNYGRALPIGRAIIDLSPDGDETVLNQFLMSQINEIKVRINNASIANGNIRLTVVKYAKM